MTAVARRRSIQLPWGGASITLGIVAGLYLSADDWGGAPGASFEAADIGRRKGLRKIREWILPNDSIVLRSRMQIVIRACHAQDKLTKSCWLTGLKAWGKKIRAQVADTNLPIRVDGL